VAAAEVHCDVAALKMNTVREDRVTERPARSVTALSVLAAAAGLLALGALLFPSAGWDDAYMTYWAAHTLSQFGAILNYNGEPVEQSSTLGFVLTVGFIRWLTGVDASVLGRIVSIAFGVATIFATARLGGAIKPKVGSYAPAIAATATYFVYWTFGGMEATLAALSAVLLLIVYARTLEKGITPIRLAGAAGLTTVFLLSRPENVFILAATLLGLAGVAVLRRLAGGGAERWEREIARATFGWSLILAAAFGAIAAFRLWYFGRIFPQPVYAKARGLSGISEGVQYVVDHVQSDFLLVVVLAGAAAVLAVIPGLRPRMRSPAGVVCGLFAIASFSFILAAGGDGMHGGRFFVPAIPVAAVLAVALLHDVMTPAVLRSALIAWIAIQLGGAVLFARTQSNSDPIWAVAEADDPRIADRFHWFERANHDHRRYFAVVAELEHQIDEMKSLRKPVSILSGQSGFVMYHVAMTHAADIRYFDRFALVTRDFVECRLSSGLSRSTWGLIQLVGAYLRRIDAFERECGIPKPDLIYEIFGDSLPPALGNTLASAGYQVVFLQGSPQTEGSLVFPGNTDVGRIYIAALQGRRARGADEGIHWRRDGQ
jgi:hypothetical protein